MNFFKMLLSKVNDAAEWCADLIVSKPELSKENQAAEQAFEVAATAVAAKEMGIAATFAGIHLTEALVAAEASATAIQGAAAIAAAGTEVAAGGVALASGTAEVVAVGAALLFSAAVVGKVAGRIGGHAYNHFMAEDKQEEKVDASKAKAKA